ncbi:ComF family protein [Bifidobacterium callimiconis]|uniref:Phosphoribosyl transferase n=1 Tax=Bifidobacterium callimiconis TaxID=2306973 RepID=A0A430FI96_9BIFI|nr:ComF family protein [Bifidobacterium callimiconis]MBT1176310.1 ComF family protein [Bifidobacterium callimiconis]RSX52566.1 phosphoribosyl transferase [Bifidobacterium callimiconis]
MHPHPRPYAASIMDAMIGLGREMRDLLLPRGCAGCDLPDAVLCDSCTGLFGHDVIRPVSATVIASGRVHACGTYRGEVRHAILMWKDHDDQELDAEFGHLIAGCLRRSGEIGMLFTHRGHRGHAASVAVVPAPSTPSSMRRRGRFHTITLANAITEELQRQGVRARCVPALSITGTQAKSVQTGGAKARSDRLRNHIHVNRDLLHGCHTSILVDDIITTGSTMRQCAQALHGAGVPVRTGFALAAVPAPSERDQSSSML